MTKSDIQWLLRDVDSLKVRVYEMCDNMRADAYRDELAGMFDSIYERIEEFKDEE